MPQSQVSPATMPLHAASPDPAFGRADGYPNGGGQGYPAQSGQQAAFAGQPTQQAPYAGQAMQQFGQAAVPGGPCPRCSTVNDASRRFCSKCGYVLIADNAVGANVPYRPPRPQGWWARMSDSHDRAARRSYRRSLPPLYRYRRVIVLILMLTVGLGGLYAFGRHPLRWTLQRWDDVRGATVDVTPLRVRIDPKAATVPGSDPNALVDKTFQSWTETWQPTKQGESCGGAPGTGTIVLNMGQPTRIREVDITAGLSDQDPNRALQARPKAIGIILDEDTANCRRFVLENVASTQVLKLDSKTTVSQIRIGIDTTFAEPADGQHVLSITEIGVRARPRR